MPHGTTVCPNNRSIGSDVAKLGARIRGAHQRLAHQDGVRASLPHAASIPGGVDPTFGHQGNFGRYAGTKAFGEADVHLEDQKDC